MRARETFAAVVRSPRRRRPAFTLAELLVVVGIIALLIAITVPPLQVARARALQTHCAGQLQALGRGLENGRMEYGVYPLAHDGGTPARYTWIDVLVQLRMLEGAGADRHESEERGMAKSGRRLGYCPADLMPDLLNTARHPQLMYPLGGGRGVDYSYGIGVPLSSAAWKRSGAQRFVDSDRHTAGRVLAGDAYAPGIYNLSGNATQSGAWNDATQFDNTVAWGRHSDSGDPRFSANLLFQDGHGAKVTYDPRRPDPINTATMFVWRPAEPLSVNPESVIGGQIYPSEPPPHSLTIPKGDSYPDEMNPAWYTRSRTWTLITHK